MYEFPIFHDFAIEDVLTTAVAVVLVLGSLVAVLYGVWGGFLMILSGGNEEKIKPAVNHIRYAIIGLVFLVIVVFVLPRFLALFSLPYADTLRATNIFHRIGTISDRIFSREGQSIDLGDTSPTNSRDTLPPDFSEL